MNAHKSEQHIITASLSLSLYLHLYLLFLYFLTSAFVVLSSSFICLLFLFQLLCCFFGPLNFVCSLEVLHTLVLFFYPYLSNLLYLCRQFREELFLSE